MLVLIPVSASDVEIFDGFAKAIEQNSNSGAYLEDNCILVVTPQVVEEQPEMAAAANRIAALFHTGDAVEASSTPEGGWPYAPNVHFQHAIQKMLEMGYNESFLWLEPDCIPIRRGWLNRLKNEYHDSEKPYMGVVKETLVLMQGPSNKFGENGKVIQYLERDGDHLVAAGGIFPSDYTTRSKKVNRSWIQGQPEVLDKNTLWSQLHAINNGKPFDVIMQGYHRPVHQTRQVQHRWHTCNYRVEDGQLLCDDYDPLPEFQIKGPTGQFKPHQISSSGKVNLDGVCLIHGCKDSSLADLVLSDELPESEEGSVIPAQQEIDLEKVALKRENEEMRQRMARRPGGNKLLLSPKTKKGAEPIKPGGRRLQKVEEE